MTVLRGPPLADNKLCGVWKISPPSQPCLTETTHLRLCQNSIIAVLVVVNNWERLSSIGEKIVHEGVPVVFSSEKRQVSNRKPLGFGANIIKWTLEYSKIHLKPSIVPHLNPCSHLLQWRRGIKLGQGRADGIPKVPKQLSTSALIFSYQVTEGTFLS